MRRLIRAALSLLLLAFASTSALACTGQAIGGSVCANPTGALGIAVYTASPVLGVPGSTTGTLSFAGSTSGSVLITPQAAAGTPTLILPTGSGTFITNLTSPLILNSTTGNASCPTCVTGPTPGGEALTKTDDTNVTLTLGGNPTHALVNAASLTLGWTGTLAAGRLNSNVVQAITNDTNVTGSIAAQNLMLGWTGTLSGTRGGTGVNNGSFTITIGGNLLTAAAFTQAGAFATTITATGITNSTLPSGSHTLAGLDVAQTWGALQQFNDGDFALKGATSGTLVQHAPAIASSSVITWPAGTTDFSATGGTNQFVAQSSVGAPFTVSALPGSFSGFANPTGAIGLSAINGSATTAMRSDAAPPLSSSVQAALTGTNHYVLLGTGAFGFSSTSPSTAGYALISNGTSADPTFQGYLNPGTGAVTLTIPQALARVYSASEFGALCNGSHDDTANIQAAIDAAHSASGHNGVLLPVGACIISSALNVTQSVVVFGNSRYNTTVIATNTTQNAFVLSSGAYNSGVHDLQIQSYVSPTAGWAILAQGINNDIRNIDITGMFSGIKFDGASGFSFVNTVTMGALSSGGTGFELNADVLLDVANVDITGTGVQSYGIKLTSGAAQFTNIQVISMGIQLSMEPANGKIVSAQFGSSWFDNGSAYANQRGVRMRPAAGGTIQPTQFIGFVWCSSMTLGNGCFDIDTSAGGSIGNIEIANPQCVLNTGNCAYIGAGVTSVKIHGGTMSGNTTNGVEVAANATDFSLININAGNYVAGANGGYGIKVDAGTSDRYVIIGNSLYGNTSGALNDLGTGAVKSVFGNPPATDTLAKTNVTNTFTAVQNLTLSTNGNLGITVTNSNGGTSAEANNIFQNGTGVASVGIAGTGYTGVSILQNRGFLYASSASAGVAIDAAGSNPVIIATGDTERARVLLGLMVGTTTDPGAGSAQLNDQFYMPNITTSSAATTGTVCWTTATGKFTADTTVGCLSSIGAAKNILSHLKPKTALELVSSLDPVSFRYKNGWGDNGHYEQFGLVAEQVASVDERMVGRDPEGKLQGVRYQELTAVLAGAIKELKADNDNIRFEINELKRNVR